MKAYKGFNKDMTCRGFQYEEGKEYETDKAVLCESGFHFCEQPLDVFRYYSPIKSVYHEVEPADVSYQIYLDSKRVAKKIKIGARLSIKNLIDAQVKFVNEKAASGCAGNAAASGWAGNAAASGENGNAVASGCAGNAAASGFRGVACASGFRGHAIADGKQCCAVAWGKDGAAKGSVGSWIVLTRYSGSEIAEAKIFYIDGETVKADTWYKLDDNGELVEEE